MENKEEKVTQPENNVEEMNFSLADLDEIVKSRLAREREKYSDYEDLKTRASELAKEKASWETEKEIGAESTKALKKVLTTLETEIADEKKSLIPENLPIYEKINYIVKNKSFLTNTQAEAPVVPATIPTPQKATQPPTVNKYGDGKYATLIEFAQKDPVAYREWARRNPQ